MDIYFQLLSVVIFMASSWSFGADSAALNNYILDYQPIHFDHGQLRDAHHRASSQADQTLHWTFSAYNRTFHLRLQPSESVFTPDHDLITGFDAPKSMDTSHIYDGYLVDAPSSVAHLSIMTDDIAGFIEVPGDTIYHIDPARKHLKDTTIHTIIYPENKMNLDPYRNLRNGTYCGNHALYDKLQKMSQPIPDSLARQKRATYNGAWYNKYSATANEQPLHRKKRDAPFSKGTSCNLYLRADQILFNHIKSQHTDGTLTAADKAREEIVSMLAVHVKAINSIYGSTIFERSDINDPPQYKGIQFVIQRVKIFEQCGTVDGVNIPSGFCTDNLDVSNFLDLNAQEDHSEYCLVHTFTYRDFIGGTLGLAWVATANSGASGVCAKYQWISDNSGKRSQKSLNTGVVTLINYGQNVPSRVSQLTFAHEVGHNFGSEHDPTPSTCAPSGTELPGAEDGNYIMFASAAQGNLPHNNEFSTCSRNDIAKVLATLGGIRKDCFKSSDAAFCGNKVVEGNETCDCGYPEECHDECCHSKDDTTGQECRLKNNKACSPSQGRCCSTTCSMISGDICRQASDCQAEATCSGSSAACPASVNKQNWDFCSNHTRTCNEGECSASVCRNIGWMECMLSRDGGASDDEMCYVACKKNGTKCISSFDEEEVNKAENIEFKGLLETIKGARSQQTLGLKKPAGALCDNYLGYCDILTKCRKIDAEGPFKQLTDIIFDPMNFEKVADWITEHWWAVLLMCVGFVIFMGVFVWLFSYNTPKINPKKKQQRSHGHGHGQGQGGQPSRSRPNPDKRSGVYSVDVPMQDRRSNQGYVNDGYRHSSYPSQPGQHFDRIAPPRKY